MSLPDVFALAAYIAAAIAAGALVAFTEPGALVRYVQRWRLFAPHTGHHVKHYTAPPAAVPALPAPRTP